MSKLKLLEKITWLAALTLGGYSGCVWGLCWFFQFYTYNWYKFENRPASELAQYRQTTNLLLWNTAMLFSYLILALSQILFVNPRAKTKRREITSYSLLALDFMLIAATTKMWQATLLASLLPLLMIISGLLLLKPVERAAKIPWLLKLVAGTGLCGLVLSWFVDPALTGILGTITTLAPVYRYSLIGGSFLAAALFIISATLTSLINQSEQTPEISR